MPSIFFLLFWIDLDILVLLLLLLMLVYVLVKLNLFFSVSLKNCFGISIDIEYNIYIYIAIVGWLFQPRQYVDPRGFKILASPVISFNFFLHYLNICMLQVFQLFGMIYSKIRFTLYCDFWFLSREGYHLNVRKLMVLCCCCILLHAFKIINFSLS